MKLKVSDHPPKLPKSTYTPTLKPWLNPSSIHKAIKVRQSKTHTHTHIHNQNKTWLETKRKQQSTQHKSILNYFPLPSTIHHQNHHLKKTHKSLTKTHHKKKTPQIPRQNPSQKTNPQNPSPKPITPKRTTPLINPSPKPITKNKPTKIKMKMKWKQKWGEKNRRRRRRRGGFPYRLVSPRSLEPKQTRATERRETAASL